jgi:hypothetical protein
MICLSAEPSIVQVQDRINHARQLVQAVIMACSELGEEGEPIAAVAIIATAELTEAVAGLEACKGGGAP